MKIIQINAYDYGSTGKIMNSISELSQNEGLDVVTCSTIPFSVAGVKKTKEYLDNHVIIGSFFANFLHYSLAQLCDGNGMFSFFATKKLLKYLNEFKPDIIHLHNMHSFYICLPLLFKYIKKNKIRVVWTFHDCWAFTGHCTHFDMINCQKWRSGCSKCPQGKHSPRSRISWSKHNWKIKKKYFLGVEEMTIVTPSEWLRNLVNQSFLQGYPVKVINNGIDLSVFYPRDSRFRENNGIFSEQHLVLGVACGWSKAKGLDVFIELSEQFDSSKYRFVIVGTDENVDRSLPERIISIHRTHNQIELAEIYSAADLFLNPTREDTFPTVNIESLACGTPVLSFLTGGSPEIVDNSCGSIVDKNDISALKEEIKRICETHPYTEESCVMRAMKYKSDSRFREYIDLYKEMCSE